MQGQQRLLQRICIRLVVAGDQNGCGLREINQCGINTVQTGAGHDADIEVGRCAHLVKLGDAGIVERIQLCEQLIRRLAESSSLRVADRFAVRQRHFQGVALDAIQFELVM